eukprot:gene17635-24520_t
MPKAPRPVGLVKRFCSAKVCRTTAVEDKERARPITAAPVPVVPRKK